MDIVFWICAAATLLMMLVYAAIGALMLMAKYRMTHVPARSAARLERQPIADLRYRIP